MGNLYTRVYYNNSIWSSWLSDRKDIDQLINDCRYISSSESPDAHTAISTRTEINGSLYLKTGSDNPIIIDETDNENDQSIVFRNSSGTIKYQIRCANNRIYIQDPTYNQNLIPISKRYIDSNTRSINAGLSQITYNFADHDGLANAHCVYPFVASYTGSDQFYINFYNVIRTSTSWIVCLNNTKTSAVSAMIGLDYLV